ncbi:hypothetical protein PpBr36_04942, partial [Pyricularia pennisetigena]|uniref:hypothetical protein n=1 Tax=Pyricularia pennisetigena TaxID=1578925 RepID=UPI0011514713
SRNEAVPLLLFLIHQTQATTSAPSSSFQCTWIPAGPLSVEQPPRNTDLLIIDAMTASQSGTREPWTSPPLVRPSTSIPVTKAKTHSSFAGCHGMSVITTPAIATAVAPLGHGIDPARASLQNKRLPRTEPRDPAPYVGWISLERAKGVVTTADISKGEAAVREQPVLVEMMVRPKYLSLKDQSKLFERAWAWLSPSERVAVMGLSHHSRGHVLHGIMGSNTFGMTLRDTPLNVLSRNWRQVLLGWGFNCTCQLCNAPSPEANRQQIQLKLDEVDEIRQDTHGGGRDAAERVMKKTFALMNDEGMKA